MDDVKALQLYTIVKRIMEFLPGIDLISASKVCTQWMKVGHVVQRQRRCRTSVNLFHQLSPRHEYAFEIFKCLGVQFTMLEDARFTSEALPHYQQINAFKFVNYLNYTATGLLNSTYSIPQALFLIGNLPALREFLKNRAAKTVLSEICPCPSTVKCNTLATFTSGVVTDIPNNSGYTVGLAKAIENEDYPFVSLLSIPKVMGCHVAVVNFSVENLTEQGKDLNFQLSKFLGISDAYALKGMILYKTRETIKSIRKVIGDSFRNSSNMAVAVAMSSLETYRSLDFNEENRNVLSGFIFYGTENLRVGSIVFEDPEGSESNEAKLVKLKQTTLFENGESFAFVLTSQRDVESGNMDPKSDWKMFKKHFPTTTLVGSFCGDNYASECFPQVNLENSRSKLTLNHYFRSHAVLLLVAFGCPSAFEQN